MENKLNITVTDSSNPVVIHLLEGDAPKNSYPVKLDIKGDINAVSDFIEKREGTLKKEKCHIKMDSEKFAIILVIDEDSEFSGQVKAELLHNPDLLEFGINNQKFFTRAEMEKLIRMNRFYFPDKDDHMKLISDFKSFAAKVNQEIQQAADQRGNKTQVNVKNVQSDLVDSFVLKIPVFKGGEPNTFRVEICFDITDSSVRFWLESVGLFEIEKSILESVFSSKRAEFNLKGFTVINC